ncbi:MAG: hypothetical protein EA366_11175 [Spirulina sp. DLM2.Bin59]|nr:MAG: hypothetical protein EA366_11175 [Spirulina sp. DLM2.Bin59]
MLKSLWHWLKQLWQRLWGKSPQPQEAVTLPEVVATPQPLTATDYEFMFHQLLEGVAHGWQSQRVEKFFNQVGDRATVTDWVNWISGFGYTVLNSPQPNAELARRLELLAIQTQNIPHVSEVGAISYALSTQLMLRQTGGEVWEYEGPDG